MPGSNTKLRKQLIAFHATRSKGSQWIELQFHQTEDLSEIARLFKLALKQY